MYQRILLAYDGSLAGRTALREGALLALRCRANVYLLSVSGGSTGFSMAEGPYPGARAHQYDYLISVLEEGVERLTAIGLSPGSRLVFGDPVEEIRLYCNEIRADLVVVGYRRQNLLDRWWSGSDSASLAAQINCSLLVSRTVMSDQAFDAELRRSGQMAMANKVDTSSSGELAKTLVRRAEGEARRA